jgi:hypothetical protein
MMTVEILGIKIPDSALAREATEFIRDAAGELLFKHSVRVYFWGALNGIRKGLTFDPELFYTAAMFHDLGLAKRYDKSQLRFEVDGANAARIFLRAHLIAEADIEKVWTAIALHTTPGVPEHMRPEIALLHAGAAMDVVGRGYGDFTEEQRKAVVAQFPREADFGHAIIDVFYDGLKHRPQSTYGTFNDDYLAFKDPAFERGDVCRAILGSHWTHNH